MYTPTELVISILALFSFLSITSPFSPCSEPFTQMKDKLNISNCKKLTTLGAEFGWNVHEGHINGTSRIDIFFGTKLHDEVGWLAWGVNPRKRPMMVGTRAIIGIRLPTGSVAIDTYNITSGTKLGCKLEPSKIFDFTIIDKRIDYISSNHYFTIFATLFLPSKYYNISKLNHVWQVGYVTDGLVPIMHPTTLQNVDSIETINLRTHESHGIGKHRHHLRMVHGILNIVGWGTFLPVGVIVARYFRVHPKKSPWWFFFHVSCQIVGYILGTVGWIIGLWLGHVSRYYNFHTHRILAIFIFTFTTLQMLALRLKPKRKDEYRKFWDMYHHFLGYALLVVIPVNIFQGIAIFKPDQIWKWAYNGLLTILAVITFSLEVYSWTKFLEEKKKRQKDSTKQESSKMEDQHNQPEPSQGPKN